MNKEDLINLKIELESKCISLTKFLINYCGIYNENIHNIKISHKDIKELVPNLKRVSFDSLLRNKTGFYTGDIIAVKDSFGNVIPYLNPMIEINEILNFDCKEIKENSVSEEKLNDNLCAYELAKLCKYFKLHNKLKQYRDVRKLLEQEKDNGVKQYKKKRDILIMKGREENDEY